MDLNLVSAFSGIQQAKTAGEIQMRVAGKALDAQRQEGAAALQLIQSAGQAGTAGDGSGRAAGLGQQVDVYA
jgi:hypothetical protein